jgi:hypothetical protein
MAIGNVSGLDDIMLEASKAHIVDCVMVGFNVKE